MTVRFDVAFGKVQLDSAAVFVRGYEVAHNNIYLVEIYAAVETPYVFVHIVRMRRFAELGSAYVHSVRQLSDRKSVV